MIRSQVKNKKATNLLISRLRGSLNLFDLVEAVYHELKNIAKESSIIEFVRCCRHADSTFVGRTNYSELGIYKLFNSKILHHPLVVIFNI